jgi:hypothetical protein
MSERSIECALWRRLDTPGHDAAFLFEQQAGFSLRGAAVFRDPSGPACIEYIVALESDWRTTNARVQGYVGTRHVNHTIERTIEGWCLDGRRIEGLRDLVDIDFGFTPATNMQLLRRTAPKRGEPLEVSVVWFDIDQTTLIELPQRYERRTERTYWYESPTVDYAALLEFAPNGFAKTYPGLWEMESD